MLSDKEFKTFPSNETEAITLLYLQKQDLSDLSPEELTVKYLETKSLVFDAKAEYFSNLRSSKASK